MKRPYIPFMAFLCLLALTIRFSFDFAVSQVPGWHTTVFSPYFIWELIVGVVLLLITIGYWLIANRANKVDLVLFLIHFALTIPTVIYLIFPSMMLDVELADRNALLEKIEWRIKLIPVAWALFIVGQILFLIYWIRTILAAKQSRKM